jgi:CheY-like chemotaxis protein
MNPTILIIEDNETNLELASAVLEASHFSLCRARTAEEGLRLARQRAPDLVLMDLSLPGLDGLAATRELKRDPATCRLKVVALTAHVMKSDQEAALNAGCDGFLAKPIDTRAFSRQVAEFIPSDCHTKN